MHNNTTRVNVFHYCSQFCGETHVWRLTSHLHVSKALKKPHLSNSSAPAQLEETWSPKQQEQPNVHVMRGQWPHYRSPPQCEVLPLMECHTTFPRGVEVNNICVISEGFCIWILTWWKNTCSHWGINCEADVQLSWLDSHIGSHVFKEKVSVDIAFLLLTVQLIKVYQFIILTFC